MALIDPLHALRLAADLEQESSYAPDAIRLKVYLKVLNLREEILARLGIKCVGSLVVSAQNKMVSLARYRRLLIRELISPGISVPQCRIDSDLDALLRRREGHTLLLTFDSMRGILLSRVDNMNLLQGTLDLLVLRTLQAGPLHGWAISERIQQISEDVLQVNQGSLYPALHRLERQGWIKAEWGVSELGRRARFYRLTASGRKQLGVETADWSRLAGAIGKILNQEA